ncbi:metal-dependent hydrolase [Acinetobacter marinus]|uniref:metal-dependent hydrolase n=1 Tax=Acinetobacter marinus TaxID=281375 RepID=UPI001FCD3CD8|nr:metal-dependent hydrolase [Acinetobacter marinus]
MQQQRSIEHQITVRKVQFDWQDTPIDWIPKQPFASYFINEINLILPEGEFWFCRVFHKVLDQINDPVLKQDVQAFIRQEALHAKAHDQANHHYLNQRGINPQRNLQRMHVLCHQILADQPLGVKLPNFLAKNWDLTRLGIIATIEHLTCVTGQYALQNQYWQQLGADPTLTHLIKWHGAEEVEHRSVAFELYQHFGGSYFSRYLLSAIVTPILFYIWIDGVAHLMVQDSRFRTKKLHFFKIWICREWYRIAKQHHNQLLPSPFWLIQQQLRYLLPHYHPRFEANHDEALAYLNQMENLLTPCATQHLKAD